MKVKAPLPVPPQLLAIAPQLGIEEHTPNMVTQTPVSCEVGRWSCSQQQRVWMQTEMVALGLWPGSRPVRHFMNMLSLWRHPPQPELIDSEPPLPKHFQLHPFFIWKPEHSMMEKLRNGYILPCLHGCPNPQVAFSGIGRPRVVIGTSGQYYILASRLTCGACQKCWHADEPRWLEKLPERLSGIVPVLLTYKHAVCKSVINEMRCSGRSPEDMSKQLTEALHLKYERAHLAYLQSVQNVREAVVLTQAPPPFGGYSDADGWCGASICPHDLPDCPIRPLRPHHTCRILSSGIKSVRALPPPVAPSQEESLSRAAVEMIVIEIPEQQQQQQQQKKKTRKCLACGQPKSRYLADGPSVHFFYQSKTVKYFYCSTKVFNMYAAEGLTDPQMSFQDFAASPFFERELEAAKRRSAEYRKVAEERAKKRAAAQLPKGRQCRFCHRPLKQGPNSPHIHTGFPGVPGKYIYCPSRVFSLYEKHGMVKEMSWREFQLSDFYKAEWDRWVAQKGRRQ